MHKFTNQNFKITQNTFISVFLVATDVCINRVDDPTIKPLSLSFLSDFLQIALSHNFLIIQKTAEKTFNVFLNLNNR